ncbi:hypothetical protein FB45DRAFT_1037795 [Roridomyces roridus]|uniref:F-box domain-containing protein n=1 Tax=Roridomyces roridus TaxID=1738132 RepID=A0AAD7FCJ7_9AGAR|nr:hypothetical protein FB45DRAFT_1037795 [Roridomyces roridus]
MVAIPQELIDAIICELSIVALKSCSLVASNFRVPSQRNLFHFARRLPKRDNYDAIHALMETSPHIASYIGHLEIHFPQHKHGVRLETLRQILAHLELRNVRQCDLVSSYLSQDFILRIVSPALVDFISRQPLRKLGFIDTSDIPAALFLQCLDAAPTFYLLSSYIDPNVKEGVTPWPQRRILDRLELDTDSNSSAYKLLLQPELAQHIANLRTLVVAVDSEWSRKFIAAVSPTIQHITFRHLADEERMEGYHFPVLQSVQFDLPGWRPDCMHGLIASIMASPVLAQITITLGIARTLASHGAGGVSQLDLALERHPRQPQVTWRLSDSDVYITHMKMKDQEQRFQEATALLQINMPSAHASGRLLVEKFEDEDVWYLD